MSDETGGTRQRLLRNAASADQQIDAGCAYFRTVQRILQRACAKLALGFMIAGEMPGVDAAFFQTLAATAAKLHIEVISGDELAWQRLAGCNQIHSGSRCNLDLLAFSCIATFPYKLIYIKTVWAKR
ncbi:hypothetical protein ABH313_21175 [Chromobacterium vaccinii]|uniref:hypothetical protein n=1 Tax=Chromobacterium vaccinii TaxID=1108595 RepID=UPI00326112C0